MQTSFLKNFIPYFIIILIYVFSITLIHELGHYFFSYLNWIHWKIEIYSFLGWSKNWEAVWMFIFQNPEELYKLSKIQLFFIYAGWFIFEIIYTIFLLLIWYFCIHRWNSLKEKNNKWFILLLLFLLSNLTFSLLNDLVRTDIKNDWYYLNIILNK